MQYLFICYNSVSKISWNCATEGTGFRAITVKQVYWKKAVFSFIWITPGTLFIACFPSILNYACIKTARKKLQKCKLFIQSWTPQQLHYLKSHQVLVCVEKRKEKIYCWNVSVLFHISLIRQNKKAITLGQENTGHGCWHSITADTYWLVLWSSHSLISVRQADWVASSH